MVGVVDTGGSLPRLVGTCVGQHELVLRCTHRLVFVPLIRDVPGVEAQAFAQCALA